MTDRIEKIVDLKAPIERVWHVLTDAEEFGTWFRVKLDGPFELGAASTGFMTYPGYEHVRWSATVVAMEAPTLFAFTWRPYAIDPDKDYSGETPTRVEFRLAPIAGGTRLHVVESGFDALPPERRDEAWRMNERGWTMQADNIRTHVEGRHAGR